MKIQHNSTLGKLSNERLRPAPSLSGLGEGTEVDMTPVYAAISRNDFAAAAEAWFNTGRGTGGIITGYNSNTGASFSYSMDDLYRLASQGTAAQIAAQVAAQNAANVAAATTQAQQQAAAQLAAQQAAAAAARAAADAAAATAAHNAALLAQQQAMAAIASNATAAQIAAAQLAAAQALAAANAAKTKANTSASIAVSTGAPADMIAGGSGGELIPFPHTSRPAIVSGPAPTSNKTVLYLLLGIGAVAVLTRR